MNLSTDQLDALTETINIGVGRASASLSQLLDTRIELSVPVVRVVGHEFIEQELNAESSVAVVQGFQGKVAGKAMLSFSQSSGLKLARLIGGFDDEDEISPFELSGILTEAGNIVLNGVLGSISNMLGQNLVYAVPDFYIRRPISDLVAADSPALQSRTVLIADTRFEIASRNVSGSVLVAFEIGSLEHLISSLLESFV